MTQQVKTDQTEKVELLRNEVHKLLDTMTDDQADELIPYLTWILETPCSS